MFSNVHVFVLIDLIYVYTSRNGKDLHFCHTSQFTKSIMGCVLSALTSLLSLFTLACVSRFIILPVH